MKKNITLILSILISFFICVPNALAEVKITERPVIKIDGKTVYRIYDNPLATSSEKTDIIGSNGAIIKLNIDGVEFIGFCIEFQVSMNSGKTASVLDMYEYFRNVLTESETKKLINTINLYTKYGYGSAGKNTDKYYLATQQLIWQTINDTGFYQSDFYEQRSGKKYDIQNFRWIIDKEAKTVIDVSSEIQDIKETVNKHYVTPSFCSSQNKLEIEIGETATYTDNNNVLSSYKVNCDKGLSCETTDNKLVVKAEEETGSKKITFLKESSGKENVMYRAGEEQSVIANQGIIEAVSCEFGINTFQNEKTSDVQILYIIIIGLFCGTMAYIVYYTKKSLDKLS